MKRCLIALGLVFFLGGGCTKPVPTLPPTEEGLPRDASSASGMIELLFFDERVPMNVPTLPTLRLKTRVSVVEGGIMSFEKAEAVFTAPDGTETRLNAGAGEYDQTSKRIALTGGITLDSNTLHIELKDFQWDNESQSGRSQSPVLLRVDNAELRAESFAFFPRGDDINPDQEVLALSQVVGQIELRGADETVTSGDDAKPRKSETTAAPLQFDFRHMKLTQAPELRLLNRRLHNITGGVAVALQSSSEAEPAVTLEAPQAEFRYSENEGMLPNLVKLSAGVRLSGSPGTIQADVATFDIQEKRFVFTGGVNGSSPEVQEFRADKLVYEPGLLYLEGKVHVASADGTVDAAKAMRDNAKRLMTFTGDVIMSSAEGTIRANQAELNEAARTMTFVGNVRGDLAEIRGFSAARIVYTLDAGDADITDLRVNRVPMKSTGENGEKPELMNFSEMAIERAPRVEVKNKQVRSISGGLQFLLRGTDAKNTSMRVRAAGAEFAYEDQKGALPSVVRFRGGVEVSGEQGNIRAETAEMRPASKHFDFSGNVSGNTPEIPTFRAEKLTYDAQNIVLTGNVQVQHQDGNIRADRAELQPTEKMIRFTGNVHGDAPPVSGLQADELFFNPATNEVRIVRANIAELNPRAPKPEDAYRLTESDIRDWVELLAALRAAETDTRPSGARRVLDLLPDSVRQALRRLPEDRPPNPTVQNELIRQFNPILDRSDFYDPPAWKNVSFDKETAALLKQPPATLDKTQRVRLNRRLFEAAFPGCVEPPAETSEPTER